MKKNFLVLILLTGFFTLGCSSTYGPTYYYSPPVTTTPTPTGISSSNPIRIMGNLYPETYPGYSPAASSAVSVYVNGTAVTNAAVTLITPYSTMVLPWDSVDRIYQNDGFGITLDYGQVYTIQATTTAGVASASCTMPGPINLSSNGLYATWSNPPNSNVGFNVERGGYTLGSYSGYSPYYLPATVFSQGSGTYLYDMVIANQAYIFSNAGTGSAFVINFQNYVNVTH